MSGAQGSPALTALVPMRHYSERVPGKNYRLIAGKPLYAHILQSLSACAEVHSIVVDTDSPVIMEGIARDFPHVTILHRPESLTGDLISINEILRFDLDHTSGDLFLQTHATNPLLRPQTISAAVRAFLGDSKADSLFSVTRLQTRLWSADGQAINHDPEHLLRTQDLPPVMEENSCLYIFRRQRFLERNNRIGRHPHLFEIDAAEAWDIDEELDIRVVTYLLESG
jgi:CMP-N-acetylneuraminic acid synthetase